MTFISSEYSYRASSGISDNELKKKSSDDTNLCILMRVTG